MTEVAHLNGSAQAALALPLEARIHYILSPRWIGYPRAKHVLDKLNSLLVHPQTHRMPCLLIVGDTNAGKTMIANRFLQQHPADDNPEGAAIQVPVLALQAPPSPDEGRFYNLILEALNAPYDPRERVAKKQIQVLRILKQIGLKMLLIDEIHNTVTGPVMKQRIFLNVLKYLSNDLQVPIVGLGTKEALRAIQADVQLANRFEPMGLVKWRLDQSFLRLLASFEHALPLANPSRLANEPLARKVLALSDGVLGELSMLLSTAAVFAIKNGVERIDDEVLAALDWTPPSERRRRAEQLA